MDLQEKFSEPEFRRNTIAVVVFGLLFPAYFGVAASGVVTLMPTSAVGVVSNWNVSFNETIVFETEDVCFADDGETCDITLTFAETDEIKKILKDNGLILAEIRFNMTYDETDEGGPNPAIQDQCDDVDSEVSAGENSVAEFGHVLMASASSCDESSMAVKLVNNYTGEGFNAEKASKSEVQGNWSADGEGWGEYVVTISVTTNTGSLGPGVIPGPGDNNNEDGEEVNVKMQVIAYELEFEEIDSSAE